jgi:hypothetical protein
MQERSSIRLWAFWAGVLGLVTGWSRLKIDDSAAHVWIELLTQAGGSAAFGALLAYIKNRIGDCVWITPAARDFSRAPAALPYRSPRQGRQKAASGNAIGVTAITPVRTCPR